MLLICGSAFFSGAETAFFNLSRRQISSLSQSKHRVQKMTAKLAEAPKKLLTCLLLGNMGVNVLYFSTSSVLAFKVGGNTGRGWGVGTAFLCFLILVMFGEIVPKSMAYLNSYKGSILATVPCYVCVQVLGPIQAVFNFLIAEPVVRVLLGPRRHAEAITINQLKMVIESSRHRGLISSDETQLLGEIIELGFLKVRHIMCPRVDMAACNLNSSAGEIKNLLRDHNMTKIFAYVGSIDNIVGTIRLNSILLNPEKAVKELLEPVHFVPEQKTVESLLVFFRTRRVDAAVVVDEYGGIAGAVDIERVVQELLGPSEIPAGIEPIQQVGPLTYRLAGNLPIHEWADAFGVEPSQSRLTTIGGLATALLGKVPHSGDVAYLKNLKFTVEKVRKYRIESLILSLETEEAKQ
ncbi:MAG: hemolysin family protein [Planctomycetota bacterium]